MTIYRTPGDCCKPVVIYGGGKKPTECQHGERYFTEAHLRTAAAGTSGREYERSATREEELATFERNLRRPKPRRKAMKRGKGLSASPEQQKATKGRACIVCGKDEAEAIIDPAHVTPRRMAPHCTCEKGTVPLCREHHERFDDLNDPFDLLPHLMSHGLYEETVHGFLEHGVSLREVMDVVTGVKWAPKAEPNTHDELEAA